MMASWRFALILAIAALLLAGCGGSDGGSGDKADAPKQKPTPSQPKEEPKEEIDYTEAQLTTLINGLFPIAEAEAKPHKYYFANNRARLNAVSANFAAFAKKTLTTHPEGAKVTIIGTQGSWDDKRALRCTDDLTLTLLTDKEGRSVLIVMTDSQTATYLIYDYRKAGKKPFDKGGYASNSGGCTTTGARVKPITSRTIEL